MPEDSPRQPETVRAAFSGMFESPVATDSGQAVNARSLLGIGAKPNAEATSGQFQSATTFGEAKAANAHGKVSLIIPHKSPMKGAK